MAPGRQKIIKSVMHSSSLLPALVLKPYVSGCPSAALVAWLSEWGRLGMCGEMFPAAFALHSILGEKSNWYLQSNLPFSSLPCCSSPVCCQKHIIQGVLIFCFLLHFSPPCACAGSVSAPLSTREWALCSPGPPLCAADSMWHPDPFCWYLSYCPWDEYDMQIY